MALSLLLHLLALSGYYLQIAIAIASTQSPSWVLQYFGLFWQRPAVDFSDTNAHVGFIFLPANNKESLGSQEIHIRAHRGPPPKLNMKLNIVSEHKRHYYSNDTKAVCFLAGGRLVCIQRFNGRIIIYSCSPNKHWIKWYGSIIVSL